MSDSRMCGKLHLYKSLVNVVSLMFPECTSLTFLSLPYLLFFPLLIQSGNKKHHAALQVGQSEFCNSDMIIWRVKILFLFKFNLHLKVIVEDQGLMKNAFKNIFYLLISPHFSLFPIIPQFCCFKTCSFSLGLYFSLISK